MSQNQHSGGFVGTLCVNKEGITSNHAIKSMGQVLQWSMLGVMGRNNRIRDVSHENRVLRITLRSSGLCSKEILASEPGLLPYLEICILFYCLFLR